MTRHALLCLLALVPVSTGIAADPSAYRSAKPFELGEVIVTAEGNTGADSIASRIDSETMRKLERTDLAEALKLSPGVVMSNTGPRNEVGISVRGFDLRQVPVFIDGIPVYVPYDGYADLRRFTTSDIAEISVAKGFSSALFGPNTMGGAINVVTRQPTKPFEGDLTTGWFQEGGYHGALNLGFKSELWYLQLGGSYLTAQGFPMSNDFTPVPTENGGQRDNAYREDWRFSIKLGLTPNETDEYALGYIYQRGEKGNPVYTGNFPNALQPRRYWQWPRWDKQTLYFIGKTQIGEKSYIKPRLYFDQFTNSLFAFDNAAYNTQNTGQSFQSYYEDFTVGGAIEFGTELSDKNTLKMALHGKFDHHTEHNEGASFYTFEDTTWSLGIEDTHQFTDRFSVTLGLSYDRREVLEAVDTNTNGGVDLGGASFSAFNPQIGLFYKLPDLGTFYFTFASKSRFPTIKDRYSFRMLQAIPNPNLEPERANHYEIGYDGKVHKDLSIHASLFAADIRDTIQRVDNVVGNRFQLQNVGESRHLGTELGLDYKPVEAFQLGVNYTYLDRKNISQPNIKLIDTPRHSFFAYADIRPLKWLSIIPSAEYGSSRWSTSFGAESGGYATFNLKASVRLPQNLTLSFGVNNLADRNYTLTEGYPEPGRTLFANLQWEF